MKTKLLKKLRKRFCDKYYISRSTRGWALWQKDSVHFPKYESNDLNLVKDDLTKRVRQDIWDYIIIQRIDKMKRRAITYYPW